MADLKFSQLTASTGANLASADLVPVLDVSDTTMAASGTNKTVTVAELTKSLRGTNIVVLYPGDNWATALAANPTNATFIIKAGVHNAPSLNLVTPTNDNLTFIGELGAIMDGNMVTRTVSASITNGTATLTSSAAFLSTDNSATTPTMVSGPMGWAATATATIIGFANTSSVTVDTTARATYGPVTMTLTRPPNASCWAAFYGNAKNITISGLEIRNYATLPSRAAIHPMTLDDYTNVGQHWIVENCKIYQNAYLGARFCDLAIYRNNKIYSNGDIGIGGNGQSVDCYDNEIYLNNSYNNLIGFDSSGLKLAGYSVGSTIHHNRIHDNAGIGLWTDVDCSGTLIENNQVYLNSQGGIVVETCYNTRVYANQCWSNGPASATDFYSAGNILISSSPNVEVAWNTIGKAGTSNLYSGIGIIAQDRVKVGITNRTVTATFTNGSAAFTLTSGAFTTADQGGFVNVPGQITTDTKWILSMSSATAGVLSSTFTGTTGSYASTTIATPPSNYGNNGYGQTSQRQRTYNINIHENDITVAGTVPAAGMVSDTTDGTQFFLFRNIRFWANSYITVPGAAVFLWMNGARTFAQWQAYSQDATVSVNTPTTGQTGYNLPPTEASWTTDTNGVQFSMAGTTISPIPFWTASTAYVSAFGLVKVRPQNPNGFLYGCTVSGTSAASAPTWPTTVGNTVTDGGVTWINLGVDPSALTATPTIDFSSSGNTITSYPTVNITSYTAVNLPPDQIVWWHIIQGTTGYTMTSPSANFKFAGAAAAATPAANRRLIYAFWSDGSNLYEMSRSVAVG